MMSRQFCEKDGVGDEKNIYGSTSFQFNETAQHQEHIFSRGKKEVKNILFFTLSTVEKRLPSSGICAIMSGVEKMGSR
jgi:hypothetical protein